MRLRWLGVLMAVLFLYGCSNMQDNPIKGNAEIDWVDFVKLNGKSYTGMWEGVIRNPKDVTDQVVGKVRFKVADVVTNPEYRTKDGDAAFLAKGTELYRVKGFGSDELIAAKDETKIGGFRIYAEDGFRKTMTGGRYDEIAKAGIERIELYEGFEATAPYRTLIGDDMARFVRLLDEGEDKPGYVPQTKDRDPDYRQMVFYANGPIAYAFPIADDGTNVYFTPRETRIVDPAIRGLLEPEY
ncbi:hypothetical protein [Cohnella caldifontis]|uniref:hypothetical protein n=1 Tax=Cohnella caldifontis TaxID=3027471 RepID=UPI0023EB6398|nr:hypothetical protein [Cohnella sp. YIM B05605]